MVWQPVIDSLPEFATFRTNDPMPHTHQKILAPGLVAASSTVSVPIYDRQALVPGVVHLGLGAFHRAHQALVFDHLLRNGDPRWGVLGVAMRSTDLADALALQEGLYAVKIADREGARWQIAGSLLRTCVAARERQVVVEALAAPATRWVTLTVTEKGYGESLAELMVDGLEARRAAGRSGLTIASCDNLSDNGHKLQRLCLDAASRRIDPYLAIWIETRCAFPNSMVGHRAAAHRRSRGPGRA
jgi:fructuronate reductase